jgi:CheY-like chemotaxis protein
LRLEPFGSHDIARKAGGIMRILFVEDSKFLRFAIERALARAGYDVCAAAEGAEALRLVHENLPDLILLDLLLPGMSGLEVLRTLKGDPQTSSIPVVVLTGLSEKNATHLHQDGASYFLEKGPLCLDKSPEQLLAALEQIINELPGPASPARATAG